jgi:hypothetical protein
MREERTDPDLESLAETAQVELSGLRRDLNRAIRLEWIRIKTKIVDACIGGAFFLTLAAFFFAAVGTAAAFLAIELRNAIGNLGAAGAILAVVAGGGMVLRAHLRHQGVREARKASEVDES